MPLPLILLGGGLIAAAVIHRNHRLRPRKVFFSFHYADIWRVNQIKKSWVTQRDSRAAGFFDYSLEEVARTRGPDVVRSLIDEALEGTEVTVVLVGAKTATRRWVKYEIEQSALRGNGLLAVSIHHLKDSNGRTGSPGANPFANFKLDEEGFDTLDEFVPEYDWQFDDGYENFGEWLREAPTLEEIMQEM